MKHYRRFICKVTLGIFFLFLFTPHNNLFAQDGQSIFKTYCASCHKADVDFTGPALKGARERQSAAGLPKDWVYKWVHNTTSMVNTDPYAKQLLAQYKSVMTAFPSLKEEEIDAVLDWADKYEKPAAVTGPTQPGGGGSGEDDNSLLYGLLTLILAIIALILLQVNSNLKKLSDEKQGIRTANPVPFYRNKAYLLLGVIVLFLIGGYFTINGAIALGRTQGYQPVQPIFYSHKVHAGTNQISCLYCHGGAQDSKHANIPSVNVCMNCHMAIKEYSGEPITREDGSSVNGNAEIKKLYEYAGWNPDLKKYDRPGKPVEWIRVHNLPDHVYFNHSQHVKVGQQKCQTCHGNIQEMPEVAQFADLSMGWCINCHRSTNVQFDDGKGNGNKFYSIYEKFHDDIKNKKYDSVTVERIGGTECQKCHY
ncbi:MAG TPA: c-type cytochrome [Chitinophagaceae bacterium]|nr:c-type cytochrome [Chitinophagaceae bacterium]